MKNNYGKIDNTIVGNYIAKYKYLVEEYDTVKKLKHPVYKKVMDFYKAHDLERRNFLKYYWRYKHSKNIFDLLPQKRGPKYKTRRPCKFIENKVLEFRIKGNNKYEIYNILKPTLKKYTPSPSGIYNITKRYNMNKLTTKMKENKRKIIKEKIGELGHIDCHYLSNGIIEGRKTKLYIFTLIDDYSRIAWSELLERVTSLDTMFAMLKSLNMINEHYNIKFEEILSDNGPEFGKKESKRKEEHPFERLLLEMGIKHRYTRAYRPQTNGKVERFWKTLEVDLLEGTTFKSVDELKDELMQYMYYYNHMRPHQGINNNLPVDLLPK